MSRRFLGLLIRIPEKTNADHEHNDEVVEVIKLICFEMEWVNKFGATPS